MKPNRRRRERPQGSPAPGPKPHAARGKPPGRARPRPDREIPVVKEHPQYGTQIPPEELEAMRQVSEERARERKNRPMGGRPTGAPPRAGSRFAPRDPGARPPRAPGPTRHGGHGGPPIHGGPVGRGGHAGPRGPHVRGGHAPRPGYDRPDRHGRPERPGHERHDRPVRPDRHAGPAGAPARPERRPLRPYRTGVQSAGEGPPRPSPAPEDPPLTRLVSILNGYQESAPLIAAHALGIFPEIQKKPQVAADVARHCDCDPRGTEVLLDALVAIGILHRHGATYVLPREIAPYVVPGHAGDATGMLEWAADMYGMWGDLARAVREGSPRIRLTSDALIEGDPARVRRYIRAVHTVSREAASRVAELAPLRSGLSLLDVGGGSGVFAAEYSRRTPGLRATLFDLPPTLDAAREILETEGYEAIPEFFPGDYRSDPFPGTYDVILLSNVLQTESEENAVNLIRKSWEAMPPGGTLLVHGMMPDAGSPITPASALFSLRMYLLFDGGRGWSAEQVSEWLARERFGVRAIRALGPPFHSKLIVASRIE
jgi:SAM-dependent methyltransferase